MPSEARIGTHAAGRSGGAYPAANRRDDAHRSGGERVALLGEIAHRESAVSIGGTGAGLIRLACGLGELGWPIDLVTAGRERLSAYGEALHATTRTHDLGECGRLRQTLAFLNYVLRHRPAVVVARDSRAIDIALTVKLLIPKAFALICAMHNPANVCCKDDRTGAIRLRARFRRIGRRTEALLAVSPGLLEAACTDFFADEFKRGVAIPNPAYRRDAAEAAMAAPTRRPVAGEPHLMFVGRLSAQKDPGTLIRAASILRHHHGLSFQLSVLGEGPLGNELGALAAEAGIADRVHLRGFVPNPMAFMADADVLVLPSVQEAFGYVLVEALAVGLPVVSTDCPYGPRYILEDGKHGRLVPVGDAERMAAAIAETLDAPRQPERLIARARDFDSREIARRYAELFEHLIAERRVGS